VNLTVLGATGSIGASTLDVVARHPDRYRVLALTAHAAAEPLLALCRSHRPRYAVLSGVVGDRDLQRRFSETGTELLFGAGALEGVTPEQACAHPNWVMGRKISVDSATMMNKGLEVIEARWLFDVPPERIEVVIHPQSIVHSLVEYVDGSVIAQLSNPDMRVPIAHALGFPERIASGATPLDLGAIGQLSFERPDHARFPCLQLAYAALRAGGTAPTLLNAANEVAVAAFLAGRLPFTGIARVIDETLNDLAVAPADDLAAVLAADAQARRAASALVMARAA